MYDLDLIYKIRVRIPAKEVKNILSYSRINPFDFPHGPSGRSF